ncbi:peptide-methionine (S)-S-oxide reductase MsrA [Thalassotalea ponticola]|uniref:peptide-methionine (S)-S-oxide reductase MsrA n=1 Tax=Thalassotalea ponticola TaxID=1523392 RepID=UPI0025B45790|nr:peptide-methionine (S)-S-oxide reductase MsrA [Thalassotalea ponticola]MDN3651906.1 peptide-methionine (S)-S-oxide reductase MsrA [Thalassotalea ponticola]
MTEFSKAYLAGGCFWCIEAPLSRLIGVHHVTSGYMGGELDNPSYADICTGTSGHAEVVEVTYDESQLSYADLLKVFFTIHDPTQLNRQGNDVGSQYRSAIFYTSQSQQQTAHQLIDEIDNSQEYSDKVVTEVAPASQFYPAEVHHQQYFDNNPYQPYCQIIIAPKLAKLAHLFSDWIKPD